MYHLGALGLFLGLSFLSIWNVIKDLIAKIRVSNNVYKQIWSKLRPINDSNPQK